MVLLFILSSLQTPGNHYPLLSLVCLFQNALLFSLNIMHLRFLCVSLWLDSSFHFSTEWCSIVWMYHSLSFTLWRTSWLLPRFSTCEHSHYKHLHARFCIDKFSANLGKSLGVLCWINGRIMLNFVRNYWSVFQSVPACISSSNEWEFLLLCILTSIWCCQVLDFSHFKL